MSLDFLPGSSGHEAAIHAGSSIGGGDVFELRAGPQGGAVGLDLLQGGSSVLTAQVPLDLSGSHARFSLVYDPVVGTAEVLDPLGQSLAFGTLAPRSNPYFLEVAVTSFVRLDDLALFDSAEDGTTPQGLVFWGAPSGRGGFAVQAPMLLGLQNVTLFFNGSVIDPVITSFWFYATGMVEGGASPYIANPAQLPTTIQQIFFESTALALLNQPGQEAGMSLTTAAGVVLSSYYTY
jgi:hypothetical protein